MSQLKPETTDITGLTLDGVCDFSDAAIALYTSDASNYRQVPLGVAYPANAKDLFTLNEWSREQAVPLLMRGAGTSQNGQCVNQALVIDCSRYMNNIIEINPTEQYAWIEPGVVCDALKAAAEQYELTFGPDPATHSRCTLGGMIGNNSCGPRSMLAGKTVENVIELDILTAQGEHLSIGPTSDEYYEKIQRDKLPGHELYRTLKTIASEHAQAIKNEYPTIKRRVSGYNLDQLLPENSFNIARALVGTEGTCAIVLRAKVALIRPPKKKQLFVLGFDDIFIAGDSVPAILVHKPIAMEGLDWTIIGGLQQRNLNTNEIAKLPEGKAWLLVEIPGNNDAELAINSDNFEQAMQDDVQIKSVLRSPDAQTDQLFWSIREQGASATAISTNPDEPDPVVGWEDTAVDPHQLGDYLRDFQQLVDRYNYKTSLYGHFGDGCIHARITFDTRSEEGVAKWRAFSEEIAKTVVKYGGSLSGEHGDGQAKAEFLPLMYSPELIGAFEKFKAAWDPTNRLNPGKVVQPFRMDENLRFGPDYTRSNITSQLHYAKDVSSDSTGTGFGRAMERCIGMGKCRSATGAMCPSFQATGNEAYSTRGRAHLLHELVRGEVIKDQWANKDIADSLEHCLSCKACYGECPTKVDIASYKSEFMYQHYQTKRRPLHHYALGYIGAIFPRLSKLRLLAPITGNRFTQNFMQRFFDLADGTQLPKASAESAWQWVKTAHSYQSDKYFWFGDTSKPQVIVWADTLTSTYKPEVLKSTIAVLTKLGFTAGVAKRHFCCGRPLYELGLLDDAKRYLNNILQHFSDLPSADTQIIVLEASCLSVFTTELTMQCPNNEEANILSKRCVSLTRFLADREIRPQQQLKQGILHQHCHDKATSIAQGDRQYLSQYFENLSEPEAGCCGMAGIFGIKRKTHDIGKWLFNRTLLNAISNADNSSYVVTTGFSCSEQIKQYTHTTTLHPAQVYERCL
jgi:FAD/FMN-containing dehydrogenase/Fe-S oxidoreductase